VNVENLVRRIEFIEGIQPGSPMKISNDKKNINIK